MVIGSSPSQNRLLIGTIPEFTDFYCFVSCDIN